MTNIAFLRGINVSGHKIIKMVDLAKMFTGMKFKNVKTYIASGNVLFESNEKDASKLEAKIEKEILKTFGFEVIAFIRTKEELEKIVKLNPFAKIKIEKPKFYVLFMKEKFTKLKLPFLSEKYAVEVIAALDNNFFCVARPDIVGSGGGANLFIEKEHKIPATTRNWNTILKIMAL
ncbi:MAG: DUF1697 domain-containing protein [Bacteroidetes bacterium]|nr:DUF1697 domain-containing protein [Bacteroidota bacterium]